MMIMRPLQQGQECCGFSRSAGWGLMALMASTGMIGGDVFLSKRRGAIDIRRA
jgi:hypothetical protein